VQAKLRAPETERLLREIVMLSDSDAHLSYILLRKCYLATVTFLIRNVGGEVMSEPLQRFDVTTLGALAAIIQEPSAAAAEAEEEAGGEREAREGDTWSALIEHAWAAPVERLAEGDYVAFTDLQREQSRLPVSAGGIGVYSAVTHREAAFLGRSVVALPLALNALSSQHRSWLRGQQAQGVGSVLLNTPLLSSMQAATLSLQRAGMQGAHMEEAGVPSHFQAWAVVGPGGAGPMATALLDLWLPQEIVEDEQAPVRVLEQSTKLQSALSTLRNELLVEEHRQHILGIPDDEDKTRLRHMARHGCQSSAGAMAYLGAPVTTNPDRTLAGGLFREAVRRSLGIERPVAPGTLCHFCNKPQTAAHAGMCNTGEQNNRHNRMVRTIAKCLTKDGGLQSVTTEDPAPFVGRAYAGRMDITIAGDQLNLTPVPGQEVRGGHQGQRVVMLDITIRHPWSVTVLAAAANNPGEAAQRGYSEKLTHYSDYDRTSYSLFPIAVGAFGYIHPVATNFFRKVAQYQHTKSGGIWPVSQCLTRWRQLISITLHRVMGESMARNLAKSKVPDHFGAVERAAAVAGYLRVHLLTPPQFLFRQ
jgi:hypothetical protein